MNLDQQLQILIEEAPKDGVTPQVINNAVNPVLRAFAAQLQHQTYFTYKSLDGNWLLTTLSNRQKPDLEKKVIYAFCTLEAAQKFQGISPDPKLMAQKIGVAHILFQLFALQDLDSIVFIETPNNLNSGKEVHRKDLQGAIQAQLVKFRQSQHSPNRWA